MWACSQQLCNKSRIGETKGALEHLLRPDDKWSSEMIVWPEWKFNVSAEQLGWQWPWWWAHAGPGCALLRALLRRQAPTDHCRAAGFSLSAWTSQITGVESCNTTTQSAPRGQHCCTFSGGSNMRPCGLLRCLCVCELLTHGWRCALSSLCHDSLLCAGLFEPRAARKINTSLDTQNQRSGWDLDNIYNLFMWKFCSHSK